IAADGDRKGFDQRARGDAVVARHGDRRVPTEARQRRRQRAEDVRQAAGLRERHRFGPDDQRTPVRSRGARTLPIHWTGSPCTNHGVISITLLDTPVTYVYNR